MPRIVRIATIALGGRGGPTVAANRQLMAGLIEQALAEKPDILALPETFTLVGLAERRLEEMAEDVPGPTLEMAARYAQNNHVYLLCPILARRPEGLRNEAFLLDRSGQIAGSYQKRHPVVEGSAYDHLEFGDLPGSAFPIFNTDFGRIGVQICFDAEYPDGWEALDRAGAEIFFWLSAYDGGRSISSKAWTYHRFVASAVQSTFARILNLMGETLAITGSHDPIIACDIDLDTGLFHTDFNETQLQAIRAKYGRDVNLHLYHEENYFTLCSNRADLPVSQIMDEFKLEPLKEYIRRNQRLQDALRNGDPLPDLTPPYLGRTQYI